MAERSEGRGQIELQIGGFKIVGVVAAALRYLRVGLWMGGCVGGL